MYVSSCLFIIASVLLGGVIPFAIVFVDLDELLKSVWQGELYLSLGYASMACMLLGVATASVTVVLVFFQLCNEVSNGTWVDGIQKAYTLAKGLSLVVDVIRCWSIMFIVYIYVSIKVLSRRRRIHVLISSYALVFYWIRTDMIGMASGMVYLVHTLVGCLLLGLCTGTLGFISTYSVIRRIYAAVKVRMRARARARGSEKRKTSDHVLCINTNPILPYRLIDTLISDRLEYPRSAEQNHIKKNSIHELSPSILLLFYSIIIIIIHVCIHLSIFTNTIINTTTRIRKVHH